MPDAEWTPYADIPQTMRDLLDFPWCETHDTTFELGDVCRYHKAADDA